MDVKAGLAQVRERIAAACARARRDVSQIELIAVSKLQKKQCHDMHALPTVEPRRCQVLHRPGMAVRLVALFQSV